MVAIKKKPKTLLKTHGQITTYPHIYKNVIMVSKNTKKPQWAQNVGPMTWTCEMTWPRCGNDVTTLSSSYDWFPRSKVASQKYLKIIRNEN